MKINVFGLGYVGCVTAACLADAGHEVMGFDIDEVKVSHINQGRSPLVEQGLEELIYQNIEKGSLKASLNEVRVADVSVICVGTPAQENGHPNLSQIEKIAGKLGKDIKKNSDYHVVNIRSTVLPGTVEQVIIPILEKTSGKKAGLDFGLCMNPEFLREGSSLRDYHHPPFTVIGEIDSRSGAVVEQLYQKIKAPLFRVPLRVAETVKYACNSFHALKVTFANEIGNFCKRLDIDSHVVMDIFCRDTQLNLSPYYLKPGFAFGGSCLPKDLSALICKARDMDLDMPVLNAVPESNKMQINRAVQLIEQTGKRSVALLGLSFKAGTDDLRESPLVELAEQLIRQGYRLSIYDSQVSLDRIFGSNRRYIEKRLPDISALFKNSLREVVKAGDVIVIGNKIDAGLDDLHRLFTGKIVIDLVRIFSPQEKKKFTYEGICW